MLLGALRTFYRAVCDGSVRKASETMGLAPSSVSRQLQILERQMGTQLLERSASGVTLTYAGRLVADYARAVVLDYERLRADLDDIKGLRRGLIRVATVEGSVSENAVAALCRFRLKHPGIGFQLRVMPAPHVVDAVKLGEVDVGITFSGAPDVELRFETRAVDPICLVVAADDPLATAGPIRIETLRALPLALPEHAFNIRQIIDRLTQAHGFLIDPVLSSDSFSAIRAFVATGSGQAVLTRLSIQLEERFGVLRALPIEAPELRTATIDVITLRQRRPTEALRRFLAELEAVIRAA